MCVFTAGERFDLLQEAMSVVCGPKEVCVPQSAYCLSE